MTSRFLVVGTGRSGTGWCAAFLNACGVPTGHQAVVKHHHTLTGDLPDWGDLAGDCTYEAVPILDRLDAHVVLVVRHPLATARSWLARGNFGDDMADRFSDLHRVLSERFPAVLAHHRPADRAVAYWTEWNLAAHRHAADTLTLEGDLTNAWRLLNAVGHGHRWRPDVCAPPDPAPRGPVDVDTPVPPLSWDDIDPKVAARAQTLARQWGYR